MSLEMKIIKGLNKFTSDIVKIYNQGKIKAPVHFNGGNALQLIEIFKTHKKGDWVLSTWRAHWHWLLSGRSSKELKQQILDGHSMHVVDKGFFTSSIVGGTAPIALGVAYALKLKGSKQKVFCFLGDMGASGGLAQECFRFASGHELPIQYVIEDNGMSVTSPTEDTWGTGDKEVVKHYRYEREFPHAGTGKFVLF